MSGYRDNTDLDEQLRGRSARTIRSMIGRGDIDLSATYDGGPSIDVILASLSTYEPFIRSLNLCSPVGQIAIPAPSTENYRPIEVVYANVNASEKAPVVIAVLDHNRARIVEESESGPDSSLLYSTEAMVRVTNDEIAVGALAGERYKLVLESDWNSLVATVQELVSQFQIHVHGSTGGPTTGPVAPPSAPLPEIPEPSFTGTQYLREVHPV